MFYSEAILSRRGPLAKVWLAAHWERKLSKTQTLQTDISQSVASIMGQEVEVMALRLSGQLLLGVVRIYSRKAKYLLDDCNEALLKIKMAFRPGIVDMTEEQLAVNRNAITLQDGGIDLDLMLPDFDLDLDFEAQPGGQHIARQADITLATADDLHLDLDDPGYGFDLGPVDGIGSQDYELDLGLDFGDGPNNKDRDDIDDSMSVEQARDAPDPLHLRESVDSALLGHGGFDKDLDAQSVRSRDASEAGFGVGNFDVDMDADMGGVNFDLGLNFGEEAPLDIEQPQEKDAGTRASSPLTDLPATPPPELTPRVAAKVIDEAATKRQSTKKAKDKKQIIDLVIELTGGPGGKLARSKEDSQVSQTQKDVSQIITKQHFLPASRTVMRLLEIRSDPVAHFMPTKPGPGGSLFFNAGPPGLTPELSALFMRPITNLTLSKRRGDDANDRPRKKARLEDGVEGDVTDIEVARRATSVARSIGLGSDLLQATAGDVDLGGLEVGMEEFPMDVEFPLDTSGDMLNVDLGPSKVGGDDTRVSTPAADLAEDVETYADADCPIATFDIRPSQSQTTGQPSQEEQIDNDEQDIKKGYSKNTVKALSIIRKELDPSLEPEGEEKVLGFSQISEKASRRAASSFFFELLVLGTRDCIKLSQTKPYENIEIRAKDKLWEHNIRQGRQASAAPSLASSMGF
ncbi:Rec8 like protein-domain-containing protein [Hysterangium stoloniferum]|nr:Rec8 like protein-domain-containing protein [Hysterangium stoloniferum]